MAARSQYALALDITDIEAFHAIFGDVVTDVAWLQLTASLKNVKSKLLSRFDIVKTLDYARQGRCFVTFNMEDSLLLDTQEQKCVLISTGRALIRQVLVDQLGLATGRKLDFSLVIAPVEASMSVEEMDRYLDTVVLEDQQRRTDDTKADVSPVANINRAEFETLIHNKSLNTYLQAIVSLPEGKVVGYEALTRGPSDSEVFRADKLFGSAAHFNLTPDLEIVCAELALRLLPSLPDNTWMSVNVGPQVLVSDAFYALLSEDKIRPYASRVVVELTEHLPVDEIRTMQSAITRLTDLGVRFSLDDTGCGFFDLDTVEQLHPSITKLCITVISQLQGNQDVISDVEATRTRLDALCSQTLGEGVETEIQRQALEACGVQLAQGYLFDKPEPASVKLTTFH